MAGRRVHSLGQFGLRYLALEADMPPGLASLVLQAQVLFTVLITSLGIAWGDVGSTITGNEMLGNGVHDARELAANSWLGNTCLTDKVAGRICSAT